MAIENVPTNGNPLAPLAGTKFERIIDDAGTTILHLSTLANILVRKTRDNGELESEALATAIESMADEVHTLVQESLQSEVAALLARVQELEAAHV